MLRFTFLFLLLSFEVKAKINTLPAKIDDSSSYIFVAGDDISKLIFSIGEAFTEEEGLPTSIILNEPDITKLTLNKEGGGVIITDNLKLLGELKKEGYINFAYVTSLFSERLIRIALHRERFASSEMRKDAIFLKTSSTDREIIESSKSFIPSVLIPLDLICEGISDISNSYKDTYSNIILKQNTAKKCHIKSGILFEEQYKTYYIALLIKNNFNISYKTFDFLKNSKKIKEIIKQNGYDS